MIDHTVMHISSEIRHYKGSDGKSDPFRIISNSVSPWAKISQWNKFHELVLKIVGYALNAPLDV